MNKQLINIIAILVLVSLMALLFNLLDINASLKLLLILSLFSIKFLIVAFHFIELKKANSFWKLSISVTVFLFFFLSFLFRLM